MFKYYNFQNITAKQVSCKLFALLTCLCVFSSSTLYAATLSHTDNLLIRSIDDKPIDHGVFSNKSDFKLSKGLHTLVVKYQDVFEDIEFAEERFVKSDYFVISFEIAEQQTLFLSTIDIADLMAAERFAKSPEVKITSEKEQELILNLKTLKEYELAKQVTRVVSSITAPSAQSIEPTSTTIVEGSTNSSSKVSSHSSAKVMPASTSVKGDKPNSATTINKSFDKKVLDNVDAVPMLKYWWSKATNEQKETFLRYINNDHDNKL